MVYVHTMPDLLVLAALIPKLFGARVVLNLHDMMPELYMSKFGISEKHPLIRFLAFQEQLSIRPRRPRHCGARSASRRALPARHAASRRSRCCPMCPIRAFSRRATGQRLRPTRFRIVYHGTIARRLGLDLAVSAFAKAAPSCPDARLEIFGDGDAGDELEAQIQASGVADRIDFSRKMFRVEDIAQMIQGASVGIICNRRDLATEYMLPVKLLEYVQLGIPAIAPRLMTIQYYFSESQVEYYEPGNVEELAAAICRLYADAGKRAELARAGNRVSRATSTGKSSGIDLYRVVDGDAACRGEELPEGKVRRRGAAK